MWLEVIIIQEYSMTFKANLETLFYYKNLTRLQLHNYKIY
jgi:hypothetical protein